MVNSAWNVPLLWLLIEADVTVSLICYTQYRGLQVGSYQANLISIVPQVWIVRDDHGHASRLSVVHG